MNLPKTEPVTAVLVGAGLRGQDAYGRYALKYPERLKFVGIADPDMARRRRMQAAHGIYGMSAFESWEELLGSGTERLATAAFICTQDNMHYKPALRAMEKGYHLVLEKPISPSLNECHQLAAKAEQYKRTVQVCHVLRFTPFWQKVKEIVDSGRIGDIVHYDHSENVSYWHFGHSYVRGHYKNKAESSPLILAKSCHDLDLMYWIMGEKAETVQSVGALSFYRPENAPAGSPDRCTDGCPAAESCPWYAPRMYITAEPLLRIGMHADSRAVRTLANLVLHRRRLVEVAGRFSKQIDGLLNWQDFPASVITSDLSVGGKIKALQEGPYGKCIFKSGNDVVDHQVANFTFSQGKSATLTVHGVSDLEGREIKIFGTKGTIRGFFRYSGEEITVTDFRHSKTERVYKAGLSLGGHGGGDFGLMDSFVQVMTGQATPEQAGTTDINGALESHYMAFAAEDARLSGETLNMTEYRGNGQ